jgi:hypothetical protein
LTLSDHCRRALYIGKKQEIPRASSDWAVDRSKFERTRTANQAPRDTADTIKFPSVACKRAGSAPFSHKFGGNLYPLGMTFS